MQHIDFTKALAKLLTATGGTPDLKKLDQGLREGTQPYLSFDGDSVANALLCSIPENVFDADQDLEWALVNTGDESQITPKQPAYMVAEAFLVAGMVLAQNLIQQVTKTELSEEQIKEFKNAIKTLLQPLAC
jgi:hypothetical protein